MAVCDVPVVLLLIAAAGVFVLWWVLPLLDRGAGTIPPSALTGVAPPTAGHGPAGPAPPSATGTLHTAISGRPGAAAIAS